MTKRSDADVFFDNRSALMARNTGWEKFARELWTRLERLGTVAGLSRGPKSRVARLTSDWWTVSRQASERDVSHFPTYPPTPLVRSRALVYTLHDLTWFRHPEKSSLLGRSYYPRLALEAVRRADVITTVSNTVAAEIQETLHPHAPVEVIYPGVVPPRPQKGTGSPIDGPYVLFVGTSEPRKNLQRLAEAYELAEVQSSVRLVIAGRRGWSPIPRVAHHVVEPDDYLLSALYHNARAVFVPSIYEGFGSPLVEALSYGLPVYASRIPVFKEVGGGFVRYFDPYSVEEIAACFKRAAEGEDAVPGATPYALSFTWDKAAEQYAALYSSLL